MSAEQKVEATPWEVIEMKNDGCYGDGPDVCHGFDSYGIYDANGDLVADTLNSTCATIEVDHDEDGVVAWDRVGKANAELIVTAVNERDSLLKQVAELREALIEIARGDHAKACPETFYVIERFEGNSCTGDFWTGGLGFWGGKTFTQSIEEALQFRRLRDAAMLLTRFQGKDLRVTSHSYIQRIDQKEAGELS